MPASGRQPINAPPGAPNSSGVPWVGLGILLVLTLILAAFVAYFFFDVGAESESSTTVVDGGSETAPEPPAAGQVEGATVNSLGYPVVATRNTTRISGSDPVDISLAAALASFPTTGPGTPPSAVAVVADDDWQAGIVASSFSNPPIGAPVLLAPSGTLSGDGLSVINQLEPNGSPTTGGNEVFTFGAVAPPADFKVRQVKGSDPATLAVRAAELRARLDGGPPDAFVVVSSENAEFSTPAATWAARSGDIVLFSGTEEVPKATIDFLKRKENADVPVFVVGPPEAVSAAALEQLTEVAEGVERVSGSDPAANSVELVRFSSGLFGWNLNDPGHGYTVARADRPMDAIAATSLSTNGTWPALLLTDSSDELPETVLNYLLDVKPGYDTDPTRALYNHVWIIGDESLVDVDQQAVIDDAAELTPVETVGSAP